MFLRLRMLWNVLWSSDYIVVCDYGSYARLNRHADIDHIETHIAGMIADLKESIDDTNY
jgi:hypothetical protein